MAFNGRLSDFWDGTSETFNAAWQELQAYRAEQQRIESLDRSRVISSESESLAITENAIAANYSTPKPAQVPEPQIGTQAFVDTIERKLNFKRSELADLLDETRVYGLERELPNLRGTSFVAASNIVQAWKPLVERLRAEVADLVNQHREALAALRSSDRSCIAVVG